MCTLIRNIVRLIKFRCKLLLFLTQAHKHTHSSSKYVWVYKQYISFQTICGKKRSFSYTDNTQQLHIHWEAAKEGGGTGTGSTFPQALRHHQVHVCAKGKMSGYQGIQMTQSCRVHLNYHDYLLPILSPVSKKTSNLYMLKYNRLYLQLMI